MKTQVSRDSYKSDKRYSGVYLQQGRMITDADWNEEAEIAKRRLDDALADAVTSGVPRANGLKIEAVSGQPLRLVRGRLYADGVGALVTGTLADPVQPFGLEQQTDFPLPDGVTPPAANYRLYADVWERAVNSLEDPDQLRDPAFHGADTASRTQTMAQLKWCAAGTDPEDPAVNPPQGDARLTLTLRRQLAGLDPCDPCASEVSVPPRIGNYLFRLEVHAVEGGPRNPTRLILKWSGENGAEQHAVGTEPADFKGSDWAYEYYTPRTEKHLGVHLAGGITPLAGQLVEGFPDVPPAGFGFVRRWDGYCDLRRSGGTWDLFDGRERGVDLAEDTAADADGHVSLGGGAAGIQLSTLALELTLTNQNSFVAGDYWLATVREAIHEPGDTVLEESPPAGIRHHYLLLATIGNSGAAATPDTNRQQRLDFPSLTTLAARDVDYTANCPSGLFDATHDTVQKALDRVCSIDATHVGFAKTCDTSIFQGVNPLTVAQALALLCDVRADQIRYTNPEDCSVLSGVNNVQDALHLLCLNTGSGGGCRTTIGVGGEFPTLQEAVATFRDRGETRFCFCLLPGEHVVDGTVDLQADFEEVLHFSLEGCGPSSLLFLRGGGISLQRIASVRLSDIAFDIDGESSVKIAGGEELVIEGCGFYFMERQDAAIRVSATRTVRFAGNEVLAIAFDTALRMATTVFSPEPSLAELFKGRTSRQEFVRDAHEVSVALTQRTAAQRRDLAAAISAQLELTIEKISPDAERVEGAERLPGEAEYQKVIEVLPGSARSASLQTSLEKALVELRDELTSAPHSSAVVLDYEGADVTLVDNRIFGELSIYGSPGDIVLTAEQLAVLRQRMSETELSRRVLVGGEGSLLLSRNRIPGEIRAGADVIRLCRDLSLPDTPLPGLLTGIFKNVRLTDDNLDEGRIQIVGREVNLNGNSFETSFGENLVIAFRAVYVGNYARNIEDITNVAPFGNKTTRDDLNHGINIVDA